MMKDYNYIKFAVSSLSHNILKSYPERPQLYFYKTKNKHYEKSKQQNNNIPQFAPYHEVILVDAQAKFG